jgi:hypothetical protein
MYECIIVSPRNSLSLTWPTGRLREDEDEDEDDDGDAPMREEGKKRKRGKKKEKTLGSYRAVDGGKKERAKREGSRRVKYRQNNQFYPHPLLSHVANTLFSTVVADLVSRLI